MILAKVFSPGLYRSTCRHFSTFSQKYKVLTLNTYDYPWRQAWPRGVANVVGGDSGINDWQQRTRAIVRKDVKLPERDKNKLAFILKSVLTKEECDDYINLAEQTGFKPALVNVGGGRELKNNELRNNMRFQLSLPAEADKIWQRIRHHVPVTWKKKKQAVGLNESLKFNRYDPGHFFVPHIDGSYTRPDSSARSYITVLIYLNEGYEGGTTAFMNDQNEERFDIVPQTGMALIFEHRLKHEGSVLKTGSKYMIRTEVMYSDILEQQQ